MTSNPISIHTTRNYADSIVPPGAMSHGSIRNVISTGANYLAIHQLISRLLKSLFATTAHWTHYDPFFRQKDEAFKSSKQCVLELAERVRVYAARLRPQVNDAAQQKLVFVPLRPDHVTILFPDSWANLNVPQEEMARICLWGNASDLSFALQGDIKHRTDANRNVLVV